MKRVIPLALIGSALFMCMGAGSGQAAALPGAGTSLSASAHASTLLTPARWRHHRCWWRHHHRHCRYW